MKKKENTESAMNREDPAVVRRRKNRRKHMLYGTFAAVLLVFAIVLQSLSSRVRQASGASIEEAVVSGTVQTGNMSRTMSSYGTLASAVEEDVSVPGSIRVTKYHVSESDAVKAGDIIATVDRSTVLAAVADVGTMIAELDEEVDDMMDDDIDSYLYAPAGGTVVRIYAESGDSVVDVMYEDGALLLLSLDDRLSVKIENNGSLHVGDTVLLIADDETSYSGEVSDVEKDSVTVTADLDDLDYGENVRVEDEDGNTLGSGELSLYSGIKVTGYAGTISAVKVSEGSTVDSGDKLFSISDTDYKADYQMLLTRREKLVEQQGRLIEIMRTGYVTAQEDGVVGDFDETLISNLNTTAENDTAEEAGTAATTSESGADIPTAPESGKGVPSASGSGPEARSFSTYGSVISTAYDAGTSARIPRTAAAPGTSATKTVLLADSAQETAAGSTEGSDDTAGGQDNGQGDGVNDGTGDEPTDPGQGETYISKTVSIVFKDADGNDLDGNDLTESITVVLSADGSVLEEKSASSENGWSVTFTDLPVYNDGNGIEYTISLGESIDGFSAATETDTDTITLTLTKDADGSSSDAGEGSSETEESSDGSDTGDGAASDTEGSDTDDAAGENSGSSNTGDSAGSDTDDAAGENSGKDAGTEQEGTNGQAGEGTPGGSPGNAAGGLTMPSAGGFNVDMSAVNSSGVMTTPGASLTDAVAEKEPSYVFGETTLCTLTPNDTVSVDISVDELDIGNVVIGSPVTVTLDALSGESFDGVIAALDPFGTNSGGNTKYTVTVSMDKKENMLLGMNASVSMDLKNYEGVLLVPEAALEEENGKTYLYTSYDESGDELGGLTEVTVGNADGTNAVILSGIEEGQAYYYRYAGTVTYVFDNR